MQGGLQSNAINGRRSSVSRYRCMIERKVAEVMYLVTASSLKCRAETKRFIPGAKDERKSDGMNTRKHEQNKVFLDFNARAAEKVRNSFRVFFFSFFLFVFNAAFISFTTTRWRAPRSSGTCLPL